MKRLMLLLMAALLASCGSPAVFERPVMEMPEGTARTSPVGTGWWRIFNDRALDRLEEKAVAHNRDLVRAAALVDQASALAAQADPPCCPGRNWKLEPAARNCPKVNAI
ncbi:hypothetical protein PVA48_09100 [Akkermansia sp. JRP_AM1]|uniref:hypothetical protein n=1 Tax=Akkermansia sp. JRP_AM1 TaxID=3414159 RepID=UPI003BFA7778